MEKKETKQKRVTVWRRKRIKLSNFKHGSIKKNIAMKKLRSGKKQQINQLEREGSIHIYIAQAIAKPTLNRV